MNYTNKYNILHLCQRPTEGFDFYRAIDNAFPPNQYQVTNIFLRGSITKERLNLYNGEVIILKPTHKIFTKKIFLALRLLNLCRKKKFKMVITHGYKSTAIANILQRFFKIPNFYSVIHSLQQYANQNRIRFIKKELVKHCKFIAISQAIKQDLLHYNPQLNPNRCLVIYNTIDINTLEQNIINRIATRKMLNINNDNFIFGTVGTEYKNFPKAHDVLIKAFAKVQQQLPKSQLIIIGGSTKKTNSVELIQQYNLTNKVYLLPHTPNAARLMSAFDIFVFPSRSEGAGKVLLEAMTHKLPIITTTAGGIPELMEPSCKLIPPDDINSLANELVKFYFMPNNEKQAMVEKNYQWIKTNGNFSIKKFQEHYRELAICTQ